MIMKKRLNTSIMQWINRPEYCSAGKSRIIINAPAHTNFWVNRNKGIDQHNAPALLLTICQDFTLTFKVSAVLPKMYDQAGCFILADHDTWSKAAIEGRDEQAISVCSTVTYGGISDWAGMPVSNGIHDLYFRIHRRNNEFLVEFSFNGEKFKWLREFSIPTSQREIRIGFYAASPKDSTFDAEFSEMMIESLLWKEKRNTQ